MDEVLDLATDYELIKDDLINREDEVIISKYLKPIVVDGASWSQILEDEDMFNKIPSELFDAQSHNFEIVKPRTDACGKSDGCKSGSWRIIGRDKLIKSEETGKILGFKKILKFCKKTKPRECKRSWVMEEYRLPKKWNSKQDQVLCKIQLMFETEISFLLSKHFSSLYTTSVLSNKLLPEYGDYVPNLPNEEGVFYLETIKNCDGNYWPSYVTNEVYRLHPMMLVDVLDPMFLDYGSCFFANRTKTCGRIDECYQGGCWRIVDGDRLIKSNTGKILGFMRIFMFCEKENQRRYVCQGEDVKVLWTIEEYRLIKKVMRDKVLCVIKVDVFKEGEIKCFR